MTIISKKKIILVCIPLVTIATIVLLLMFSPGLRHNVFRASVELPGLLNYLKLRTTTVNRDFKASSSILMQQLSFIESFSDSKNSMLPMLLANTQFVMRQTRLQGEAQDLLPYLESLAAYQDDIFNVHIWLAEALLAVQPGKALKHAQAAQKILPNDDRSYRIAIEAALNLNQDELVAEQCAKYKVAKHGAFHDHYEYDTLFEGVGVKKFGLEIDDGEGGTQLIIHNGLLVEENVVYSFSLPHPGSFKNLRIHLGLMPGISVDIKEIWMFREGLLVSNLEKDRMSISARYGFFQDGALNTVSRNGDLLILRLPGSAQVTADKVNIKMTLKRLSPVLSGLC